MRPFLMAAVCRRQRQLSALQRFRSHGSTAPRSCHCSNSHRSASIATRRSLSSSSRPPAERSSNASNKYFTTKTNQDNPPSPPVSAEEQLAQLRSEISQLSYALKQLTSQQSETQALSRRAEARAYIIENKLMDIQSHVVKIPALETLAHSLRQYLKDRSPQYVSDALRKVNESGAGFLTNKYTVWGLLGGVFLFWQYRLAMYRRTSEEVANVAAMTLQQDSLRETIQETLSTVANSPETLASLSSLFQKLIREERTERHLIELIVRALNSEGVRDAAIYLLEVCFQNEELRRQAGVFLTVAANATVLDEGFQKNTGVGIQQALKSAVIPGWAKGLLRHDGKDVEEHGGSAEGSRGGGKIPPELSENGAGGGPSGSPENQSATNANQTTSPLVFEERAAD